jgi:HEAT repeat protein
MVLVHIGGAAVVAELLRCLGNGKKTAYVAAILALLFAPIALPIVALFTRHRVSGLIKAIKNSNASFSRGRITDTEIAAHAEASRALADVRNPTAVEPLTRALRDRDAEIRQIAASVLGEIGDKRAIAPLIQALKDRDSDVRSAAAAALGKIGDAQAVEPLNAALKDENDSVRSTVAQALDAIAGKAKA